MSYFIQPDGAVATDAAPPAIGELQLPSANASARARDRIRSAGERIFQQHEAAAAVEGAAGVPERYDDEYAREQTMTAELLATIEPYVRNLDTQLRQIVNQLKHTRAAFEASPVGRLEAKVAQHHREFERAGTLAGRAPGTTDGSKLFITNLWAVFAALGAVAAVEFVANAQAFEVLSNGSSTARYALAASACVSVAAGGHFLGHYFKRGQRLLSLGSGLFVLALACVIGYYRAIVTTQGGSGGGSFGEAAASGAAASEFDPILFGFSVAITLVLAAIAAYIGHRGVDSDSVYHELYREHHTDLPEWESELSEHVAAEARLAAAGSTVEGSADLRAKLARYEHAKIILEGERESARYALVSAHKGMIEAVRKANTDARPAGAPIPGVFTTAPTPVSI